jgi:hypothetical protein
VYVSRNVGPEAFENKVFRKKKKNELTKDAVMSNKIFHNDELCELYRSLSVARGCRFRFPVGAGNFSLHHRVQNGSGAHPASYSMGTGALSLGIKRPGREADPSVQCRGQEWAEPYLHSPNIPWRGPQFKKKHGDFTLFYGKKLRGWEVDGNGSGSCPMAVVVISGVKFSVFSAKELVEQR